MIDIIEDHDEACKRSRKLSILAAVTIKSMPVVQVG